MANSTVKILLVEDDEEDAFLVQEMLSDVHPDRYRISWASTYEEGISQLFQNSGDQAFDVGLVDYSLGASNGLDLIMEAAGKGIRTPLIMVTGRAGYEVDLEAMQAGAVDFLSKNELRPSILERTIRYAIERRRGEDELERRVTELETLVNLAGSMRSATTPDQMYPIVLEQIIDLMKVDGAAIATRDPATNEVIFRLGMGSWAGIAGESLPVGAGMIEQVLSTGRPILNNKIQEDPTLAEALIFRSTACGACIPLSTHQQTIGAFWVGRSKAIHESDVKLLSAIGDMAANAIHRATLFEQTQLRLQRLSGLHTIDLAINSSLDLQLILTVYLDQVTSQLGIHAADVLQFDDDLRALNRIAERGFLPGEPDGQFKEGWERLVRHAFFEQKPVIIPDLRKPAQMGASPKGLAGEYFGERISDCFGAYFAVPLIAKGKIKGVLELFHHTPFHPGSEWLDFLQTLAFQGAIAIDNAELFFRLQRSNEELSLSYNETIRGWSGALDLRDRETHGHSERVTELAVRLARRMGVSDVEIGHIRRGALLHDIGKMAIPDAILQKPGSLDEGEWEIMRRHPAYSYQLLSSIPYLKPALDIPYGHHERWDGSGYPRGLKGEAIPLAARIFAVVDVWDAMRSDRPYRPAISVEKTVEFLSSQAGILFDPAVVSEFLEMLEESD
jgi:response regulator RpfG family c-di-GMP phosphodiesterase